MATTTITVEQRLAFIDLAAEAAGPSANFANVIDRATLMFVAATAPERLTFNDMAGHRGKGE